jgi:hypothetical protein
MRVRAAVRSFLIDIGVSWPLLVNLRADPYEQMSFEPSMYLRWYADNMRLFIPIGQKIQRFLAALSQYPMADGLGMQPSNINYLSLKG